MRKIFWYETDIGKIGIVEERSAITNLLFDTDQIPENISMDETKVLSQAGTQLTEYLSGVRKMFTLPLAPKGTSYMQNVWDRLRSVPYGDTRTYKEIAEIMGNPHGSRSVGLACSHNPIPIFIPCHRIIGSDGSLTGYRGGIRIKSLLLELER